MRSKDLAEMLMEHPEWNVSVSVDISRGEYDWQLRAFGDILELMNDNRAFVILCEGATNLEAEVEQVKDQLTAAEERERIVSWLRARGPKYNFSDQRELVAGLSKMIEAGEHCQKENDHV